MAVGSGLLDANLSHTEVNKAVVCHCVKPVESQVSQQPLGKARGSR